MDEIPDRLQMRMQEHVAHQTAGTEQKGSAVSLAFLNPRKN